MNRSQFLATLLLLGVIGGIAVTQLGGNTETTAAPAASPAETAEATAPAEAAPVEEVVEVEVEAPPILDPKPALVDLDGWLQTENDSLDDWDGQVRIVEFWTFGCFNCKNRIPFTQAIYERWQPEGLEIIGIHTPEFEWERDPDVIAQAAIDLGVPWPIALDTDKTNFRAWQENRRFWPRVYVLDQNGDVRYDHIGEGDYDGLEEIVAHLIENGP